MKVLRWVLSLFVFEFLSVGFLSAQDKEVRETSAADTALHYWDQFDFKNTSLTPLEEEMETFIQDYLQLLNQLPENRAASLMEDMMHSAAADSTSFARLVEIYETFLTDRNSPVYNEPLMRVVLQKALDEPVLGEIDKVRPTMLLELLSKNREGMKAADFDCTFSDGSSRKMTSLAADYLLLFFYDPDCDHCEAAIAALSASSEISTFLQSGKLKILAVYPDEDIEAWKTYSSSIPDSWMNCYNASLVIRDDELYDLMETPTIYLLDKEHKVIHKNIHPDKVIDVLNKAIK